jgi:homoserine O-acetyltransferase
MEATKKNKALKIHEPKLESFELESGRTLPRLRIAYTTLGEKALDDSNVVWLCHALSGSPDPREWWPGMVGEGKTFDPQHHYIVCANILGSCYGTTGPLDEDPDSGEPYYELFPEVSVRDMVWQHELLREHLGIRSIRTLAGSSLGGHQAMEWALQFPELVEELILISTNAKHSEWGKAFNEAQRMAIRSDRTFYGKTPEGGAKGLAAARAIAMLGYRTYADYARKGSSAEDPRDARDYQRHQGDKFRQRFNAHAYYVLSRALDSHDVGRGRGSIENALGRIRARTLVIGMSSDRLYPPKEQKFLADHIPGAEYREIETDVGHDGFLVENEALSKSIGTFIGKTQEHEVQP